MIGGRAEFVKTKDGYEFECIGKAYNTYVFKDGLYINGYNADEEVLRILKENFKSIEIEKDIFKFNDTADEAYFLLWSNEGIEI